MSLHRVALFALLGVALVAATPVAVPTGDTRERVYTYEAVVAGEPEDARFADCDRHPLQSRECVVARYLADGNTITYDSETGMSESFANEHEYVGVPDGYYRPVSTVENHTVVLGMEPVSLETVQRDLATDAGEWPVAVGAIENGTAQTTEKLPRTHLRHEERVYDLRIRESREREANPIRRLLPGPLVGLVRALGYLGGFASLWCSGVAFARLD